MCPQLLIAGAHPISSFCQVRPPRRAPHLWLLHRRAAVHCDGEGVAGERAAGSGAASRGLFVERAPRYERRGRLEHRQLAVVNEVRRSPWMKSLNQ